MLLRQPGSGATRYGGFCRRTGWLGTPGRTHRSLGRAASAGRCMPRSMGLGLLLNLAWWRDRFQATTLASAASGHSVPSPILSRRRMPPGRGEGGNPDGPARRREGAVDQASLSPNTRCPLRAIRTARVCACGALGTWGRAGWAAGDRPAPGRRVPGVQRGVARTAHPTNRGADRLQVPRRHRLTARSPKPEGFKQVSEVMHKKLAVMGGHAPVSSAVALMRMKHISS
jgi:hypothetical protein